MSWVRVDRDELDAPKIARAAISAGPVSIVLALYAKTHADSDGIFPEREWAPDVLAHRWGTEDAVVVRCLEALIKSGYLVEVEGGWQVDGFESSLAPSTERTRAWRERKAATPVTPQASPASPASQVVTGTVRTYVRTYEQQQLRARAGEDGGTDPDLMAKGQAAERLADLWGRLWRSVDANNRWAKAGTWEIEGRGSLVAECLRLLDSYPEDEITSVFEWAVADGPHADGFPGYRERLGLGDRVARVYDTARSAWRTAREAKRRPGEADAEAEAEKRKRDSAEFLARQRREAVAIRAARRGAS